jgi:hypothetical protein
MSWPADEISFLLSNGFSHVLSLHRRCAHSRGIWSKATRMSTNNQTPAVRWPSALARLYWIMIGPMMLFVTGYLIVSNGRGWWSPSSLAFIAWLVGLAFAKWLEFQGGNPQTSTGEPATPADLRRYLLAIVVLGPIAWIVANVIGN